MRAHLLSLLVLGASVLGASVLGACAPDIVSGAYLCGPEQLCPEGQACNGEDNTCVLPGSAQPFACGKVTEVEPNNGATAAEAIPNLQCVSALVQIKGCTPTDDGEDWFSFDVPAQCGATVATMRIGFPEAYEQLSLELGGAQGTTPGTAEMCDKNLSLDTGDDQRCLKASVTAGGHYTVRVARSGAGNCGGACGFNRYTLTLQLGTP